MSGACFAWSAAVSFWPVSSYEPWNWFSTTTSFWLWLNRSTIAFWASALTPVNELQSVTFTCEPVAATVAGAWAAGLAASVGFAAAAGAAGAVVAAGCAAGAAGAAVGFAASAGFVSAGFAAG